MKTHGNLYKSGVFVLYNNVYNTNNVHFSILKMQKNGSYLFGMFSFLFRAYSVKIEKVTPKVTPNFIRR